MINRTNTLAAVLLALALAVAACGSDDSSDEPAAAQQEVMYRDGTVTSVTSGQLLLQTAEGQETYVIDQAAAPVLGLDHIASHAGANIAFRIYYFERDGRRYLVRGEELGAAP